MSIGSISGSVPDFSSLRARMQESISQRFKADDTDQSGGLSLEEFTKAQTERAQESGGSASLAGGASPAAEMFAQFDQDSDGEVTETELADARPPAPQGSFSTETLEALLAAQEEEMAARFAANDTDQSDGLSLDEFTQAKADRPQGPGGPDKAGGRPSAEEMFARLDTDGDGEVTQAELAAAKPSEPQASTPSDTLSALLSAQEESASSSLLDILSAASKSDDSSQSDLLSQILGGLADDG